MAGCWKQWGQKLHCKPEYTDLSFVQWSVSSHHDLAFLIHHIWTVDIKASKKYIKTQDRNEIVEKK